MLPEYDGRELSFEEKLGLSNKGQIAEVVKWISPYYSSEDGFKKLKYREMIIRVDGEKMIVYPVYYRLGWKFKKE